MAVKYSPQMLSTWMRRLRHGESLIHLAEVYRVSKTTIRKRLVAKFGETVVSEVLVSHRDGQRPPKHWRGFQDVHMQKRLKIEREHWADLGRPLLTRTTQDLSAQELETLRVKVIGWRAQHAGMEARRPFGEVIEP